MSNGCVYTAEGKWFCPKSGFTFTDGFACAAHCATYEPPTEPPVEPPFGECLTDFDCQPGWKCINGVCVEMPPPPPPPTNGDGAPRVPTVFLAILPTVLIPFMRQLRNLVFSEAMHLRLHPLI